jgi:hemerythrin-like metal-binding protein
MSLIEWNENYSVRNSKVDSQHKKLFQILDSLFDAVDSSGKKHTVGILLQKMVDYSEYHFATEENLMEECQYPDLSYHVELHEGFRVKTHELYSRLMQDAPDVGHETVNFLYEWLNNHILGADQQYAPYIAEKQDAEAV